MIRQRIEKLTLQQREALAERIRHHFANRPTSSDSQRSLVAWYTAQEPATDRSTELREYLRQRLPAALIPQHFVRVSNFPRTATGKVDRRSLSESVIVREPAHEAPATFGDATQHQIFEIFAETLGTRQFTIDDNFFELGGDSLATIQVIALCSKLGKQITLQQFHAAPTVKALAATTTQDRTPEAEVLEPVPFVGSHTAQSQPSEPLPLEVSPQLAHVKATALPLNTISGGNPFFLIPPRGNAVAAFQHLIPKLLHWPCYALVSLDRAYREIMTIPEFAQRFLVELKQVQGSGPYRLAGMCEGAYIAWELACLLRERGEAVEFLGMIDTAVPSSLKRKPLTARLMMRLHSISKTNLPAVVAAIFKRSSSWLARKTKSVVTHGAQAPGPGTRMGWSYAPRMLDCRAALFRAHHPPQVSDLYTDYAYGWDAFAKQGLDIYTVQCTSDDMMEPENAERLAMHIEAAVTAAQQLTRVR